ncbi:MAG: hypothetical protein UHS49_00390 [Faecalimonas sp.]|nr:hypothetical protein [Faecalimonas sp.]
MSKVIDQEKVKEEKKKNKKLLVIAIVVAAVVLLTIAALFTARLTSDFDAQAYTRASLDHTFRGETKELLSIVEGVTEEELKTQYEEGVATFVEKNITSGIAMDAALQDKFYALGKQIFASMKYEVKEAERVNAKEYRVPVEYQAVDVFDDFPEVVSQEYTKVMGKADKGEYQGSRDEIKAYMEMEFLNNCYTALEGMVQQMSYAEPETMVFTVKKGEDGIFALDGTEIYEFIQKIINLGEIQD